MDLKDLIFAEAWSRICLAAGSLLWEKTAGIMNNPAKKHSITFI
jgi:hypothetical protein